MLQRVSSETEKQGSLKGPAVVFYALSVIVAFIAGGFFERAKAPPVPVEERVTMESTPETTPASVMQGAPSQTPLAITSKPAATAALITVPSATPARIERAIAVAHASAPVATPAMAATPAAVAMPTPVVRQAGQVAVTKDIEAPVKQGSKITGYIYLKAGQFIKPASVDHDQIKVVSGEGYAFVPVNATDMSH